VIVVPSILALFNFGPFMFILVYFYSQMMFLNYDVDSILGNILGFIKLL
jgi:hypothetical protein